jgi:hypothetical protein
MSSWVGESIENTNPVFGEKPSIPDTSNSSLALFSRIWRENNASATAEKCVVPCP